MSETHDVAMIPNGIRARAIAKRPAPEDRERTARSKRHWREWKAEQLHKEAPQKTGRR